MGYRDDGFFNINWAQDAKDSGPSAGGKQNPPFLFPDKSIRFLDAQAELQRKFNTFLSDTVSRGDYQIHRGYIRNLEQPQFGEVPISKCNFQFNPQEIRQSVSMREDIYLPLLQDTAQLSQPIGAVVNFTFDLMFDRSHELSKGIPPASGNLTEIGQITDPLNPNPEKDAYDIGVLADLRILYSVIGQGFSREMLEFQKKTLIAGAERQLGDAVPSDSESEGSETEEGTSSATTTTTSDSLGEIDDEALNEILEANYGNWGLLMPNPVRVMFSSLFMLDGFITGTNVDFLKFNTKMVPIMCRVTMNMSAMYIGFARQDTFLTKTFKDASEALEEERRQNEATKTEIIQALLLTGNRFAISTAWENISTDTGWDTSIRSANRPLPLWSMVVNDKAAKNPANGMEGRAIFLGFPAVTPKEGGYDETLPDGTSIRRGADTDYILKLYEESLTFTISYSWDVSIYGGITQGTGLSQSQANALITNKNYTSTGTVKLVGKYSGTESASSKEDWGSGKSGNGAKAERVRRRSIRGNDKANNEALGQYAIHGVGDGSTVINSFQDVDDNPWIKTSYYVVETNVTISITYGSSSEELSLTKNYVEALSGNQNYRKEMNFNWHTADPSDNPSVNGSVRFGDVFLS